MNQMIWGPNILASKIPVKFDSLPKSYFNLNEYIKIDHQIYPGEIKLASNKIYKGTFRFASGKEKRGKAGTKLKPHVIFFPDGSPKDSTRILFEEISTLDLFSSKTGDTIKFKRDPDNNNHLLKNISIGTCRLFSNSLIIDELEAGNFKTWTKSGKSSTEFLKYLSENDVKKLQNYFRQQEKQTVNFYFESNAISLTKIKMLKDVDQSCGISPYLINVYNALSDSKLSDIVLLFQLTNAKDPMGLLPFWRNGIVYHKNKSESPGKMFIQRLDYSSSRKKPAYLHFHDGKGFQLMSDSDIDSLFYNGTMFFPIVGMDPDERIIGSKWTFNNESYYISFQEFNKYTLYKEKEDKSGLHLMFFKAKKGGRNKHIYNDAKLRKAYLKETKPN